MPTHPSAPRRTWTLTRLAALATTLTLATAAGAQAPQTVQPSSQGTSQSAPQDTPQPAHPGSPQPPAQLPAPTPPPQGTPAPPPSPQPSGQSTPYTAPDGTASVNLPAGWKATQGVAGLIVLQGQGTEAGILGRVVGAHNAPYNPAVAGGDNTAMSMPWNSTFQDKVGMLVERLQIVNGRPAPQGSVTSVTSIRVPNDLGQCGSFTGNMTLPAGNVIVTGSLCVLPLENRGDYKTIMTLLQAPATEAATFPAVAQSIFSSYNVPIPTLELLLKPWDQTAGHEVLMNPVSSQCFQLAVLHLAPTSQLPGACGGTAP